MIGPVNTQNVPMGCKCVEKGISSVNATKSSNVSLEAHKASDISFVTKEGDIVTLFSKEEKAKRKHTIKVQEWMRTRDNVLGIRPTPPPQVIHHPRFFDPPLSCRDGHHKWYTKMLMGIPILK